MNAKLKELSDKFLKAMHDAEEIRKKYEGSADNMTPEEEERYDKFLTEADGLKAQIERMQKTERLETWKNQPRDPFQHGAGRPGQDETAHDRVIKAYSAVFLKYLQGQTDGPKWQNTPEYREWQALQETPEFKAYQADNPAGGGFGVVPQQLVGDFLTLMKDLVFVRQLATVYGVTSADTLGVPAIDTDPSDSDWTSELAVGSEEATAAVGKREFRPSPLAKYIKLSKKLLRQVPNFETVILDRLAYKMAVTEEKAFLSGTGANQPLGVYTASTQGISTSRDVTSAAATAIAGDDVMDCFYNLKAQYRKRAAWLINRAVVKAVRKAKDSSNSYLWQPGLMNATFVAQGTTLIGGTPDTLMGRPVYESEYAPSSITANNYTMLCGDFSFYWIADALDMQMQVLYELFALSNQMGYILRKETDGMPVLEEAFSRLKQHA